jgi:hypothetical protein
VGPLDFQNKKTVTKKLILSGAMKKTYSTNNPFFAHLVWFGLTQTPQTPAELDRSSSNIASSSIEVIKPSLEPILCLPTPSLVLFDFASGRFSEGAIVLAIPVLEGISWLISLTQSLTSS